MKISPILVKMVEPFKINQGLSSDVWASGEWVLCWAVGSGLFWEQLHGWLAVSPALCVKEEGHRVKRAESKERKQTGRSVAPGGPWQPSGRRAP